jgi:ubiquinone/menaquinone biosynthesis C-methylase UbiE
MNPHAARSRVLDTTGFAHPVRNVAALGIEPGMIVADFGSGSGAYVLAIAERLGDSGTVYAIDIQKDLLRRTHNEAVKRGFKNVQVLWGDLEKSHGSKLAKQSCDLVLVSNLLFQVEDKESLFREAHRILRPLGRLAVVDWQESFGGMGPTKDAVVDGLNATALAEKFGFEMVKSFAAGAHHYGLLFQIKVPSV